MVAKFIMSKKIINAFKSEVKKFKYADFKAKTEDEVISGYGTYKDLNRMDITINGKSINRKFIIGLYSKYENLILQDENGEKNYRLLLKEVFREMFMHAGATVPNSSIIEELIDNYYQGGYIFPAAFIGNQVLGSLNLMVGSSASKQYMNCCQPDRLKLSFSMKYTNMCDIDMYNEIPYIETCDLCSSAEFQLQFKDGNVTYEDGKILLTIPKELENYKAGDDNLLDKLMDLINKVVEYFKKLCEKLGFKFDTKVEYDSQRNIRMEHNLGKPLKVIDKPDISLGCEHQKEL